MMKNHLEFSSLPKENPNFKVQANPRSKGQTPKRAKALQAISTQQTTNGKARE